MSLQVSSDSSFFFKWSILQVIGIYLYVYLGKCACKKICACTESVACRQFLQPGIKRSDILITNLLDKGNKSKADCNEVLFQYFGIKSGIHLWNGTKWNGSPHSSDCPWKRNKALNATNIVTKQSTTFQGILWCFL